MGAVKVSQDLRPMSDLKSRGADIVRQTTETGRPVYLTKHGQGVAVVMSIGDYERMEETIERLALERAIAAGERDVSLGRLSTTGEVMTEVEGWLADADGT